MQMLVSTCRVLLAARIASNAKDILTSQLKTSVEQEQSVCAKISGWNMKAGNYFCLDEE